MPVTARAGIRKRRAEIDRQANECRSQMEPILKKKLVDCAQADFDEIRRLTIRFVDLLKERIEL